MSGDFILLVITAVVTAFGFWASLKTAPRHPAAWVAALLFLAVGVLTVVHITLAGAGELLPGRQLNPKLWQTSRLIEQGWIPGPRASFCFVAILAHILVVISKPSKATTLLPAPATVFFVIYFFLAQSPREISFAAPADGQLASAHLTMITKGDKSEMLFAIGNDADVFLEIVYRHEADSRPPEPWIRWSGDGKLLTFTTRRAMPFFALDLDGNEYGWLPTTAKEWPRKLPSPADDVDYRRRLSAAQVRLTQLLNEHMGISKG